MSPTGVFQAKIPSYGVSPRSAQWFRTYDLFSLSDHCGAVVMQGVERSQISHLHPKVREVRNGWTPLPSDGVIADWLSKSRERRARKRKLDAAIFSRQSAERRADGGEGILRYSTMAEEAIANVGSWVEETSRPASTSATEKRLRDPVAQLTSLQRGSSRASASSRRGPRDRASPVGGAYSQRRAYPAAARHNAENLRREPTKIPGVS